MLISYECKSGECTTGRQQAGIWISQAVKEMGQQEILIKNLGYLQFICNLTLNLKVI